MAPTLSGGRAVPPQIRDCGQGILIVSGLLAFGLFFLGIFSLMQSGKARVFPVFVDDHLTELLCFGLAVCGALGWAGKAFGECQKESLWAGMILAGILFSPVILLFLILKPLWGAIYLCTMLYIFAPPFYLASLHYEMFEYAWVHPGPAAEVNPAQPQTEPGCVEYLLIIGLIFIVAIVLLTQTSGMTGRPGFFQAVHFVPLPDLHQAVANGDVGKVRDLLASGADINGAGELATHPPPIAFALTKERAEMFEFLIEHGARVPVDGYEKKLLVRSLETGYLPSFRVLYERTRTASPSLDLSWLLVTAADRSFVDVAEFLLESGCNVNVHDPWFEEYTPLHRAKGEHITRLLLEHGADVNALEAVGKTPLHMMAENGFADLAELLLSRGALVDVPDKDGHTPLLWAKDGKTVQVLLKHGAKLDFLCKKGTGALAHARHFRRASAVQALLDAGAVDDPQKNFSGK